jgi:hypothetical protein
MFEQLADADWADVLDQVQCYQRFAGIHAVWITVLARRRKHGVGPVTFSSRRRQNFPCRAWTWPVGQASFNNFFTPPAPFLIIQRLCGG